MKTSYDELYAKLPDTIGRPVRVANPDPLHNNTKISDNGTYDVSSFAVAKIDVEGGGGGGSAELHPELTLNVSPHNSDANVLNGVICLPDNAAVLENGCLVALDNTIGYTTTIQDGNTGTGTVILSANREDGQTYAAIAIEFLVYSANNLKRIVTVTASNLVNCSYDEDFIIITDITKEASIDLDVVFDGGVG